MLFCDRIQKRSEICQDKKTDIYAFGICYFNLLNFINLINLPLKD